MSEKDLLQGKRVLTVDDEPDVLASLSDLLAMCDVVKASNFEDAQEAINGNHFDIVILDIMGVNGYELLEIAKKKKLTTVMLTAHALSIADTKKSIVKGADLYIPKEEMINIGTLLNDVLEARETGKGTWFRWLDRLGWYFDNRFGPDWKDSDKDFWDEILQRKP